jgi:hypothetical protein
MPNKDKDTFKVVGEDLVKQIKGLFHEGNIRKIRIKDEKGKNTYLEIPVTIGVIGAVLVPVLAVVGALGIMVGVVTVEVIRAEESKKKAAKTKKTSVTAKKK